MYTLQDFAERYKKSSNSELLEILQNPSQYQLIALTASKSEFASRKLPDDEVNEARQILLDKKNKIDRKIEKQDEIKAKLIDAGNVVYDTVSPFQSTISTAGKIIKITAIAFTFLIIYNIAVNYDLYLAIINGNSGERFGYTLYLFPILVELTGTILFWLKKKSGWLLLSFFCSFSLIELLHGLYYSVSLQFQRETINYFFPAPSPAAYILMILFYVGTIFALTRQDIREIYRIHKKIIKTPLIIGVLSGLSFLWLLT